MLNDPVNWVDPLGLEGDIVITGKRCAGIWVQGSTGLICASTSSLEDFLSSLTAQIFQPLQYTALGGEGGGGPGQEKPKPTILQCLAYAANENRIGLSLDILGGLIEATPVGRVAKAITNGVIGITGIGAGIAEKDPEAAGAAFTHKEAANFSIIPTGSWAKVAHRTGLVALAYSTVHDLRKTAADYQACMSGKAGP